MSDLHRATSRRGFMGRLAAATAAMSLGARPALAEPTHRSPSAGPDDWMDVKAKHKQLFDSPEPNGALPLVHVRNFLHTYQSAYKLAPKTDVAAAYTLYFMTVPLAFDDAMWEKYKLGAAANVIDTTTNAPAIRNVFRTRAGETTLPVKGVAPFPSDSGIEALQANGTTFILCNNAFNFWTMMLGGATNQNPADIRTELEGHLLPGITIVPAMVIAINRAQEKGWTYMYLR